MRKVRLTKKIGGSALRTESITGISPMPPELNYSYVILSDSLDFEGGMRSFQTSMVQKIEPTDNGYILTTLNSVYEVEFLSDDEEDESLDYLPKEG